MGEPVSAGGQKGASSSAIALMLPRTENAAPQRRPQAKNILLVPQNKQFLFGYINFWRVA
jgi:hypothetical protein